MDDNESNSKRMTLKSDMLTSDKGHGNVLPSLESYTLRIESLVLVIPPSVHCQSPQSGLSLLSPDEHHGSQCHRMWFTNV